MRAFLGVKGLWLIGLIGPNKANKIVLNGLGAIWLIRLIGPNKTNKRWHLMVLGLYGFID